MGVWVFAALVVYAFAICHGQVAVTKPGEYMVCKPVAGVFGVNGGKNSTQKGIMPVLQGPMGPPGPPGRTGLQGPKGLPDYRKVESLVTNYLQPLKSRMYQLGKLIDSLKAGGIAPMPGQATPPPSKQDIEYGRKCQDTFKSPVNIGKMCYLVIGRDGLLWSHDTAQADCKKRGGQLADLDSRTIYDRLYDYIDTEYNSVVQAWTGMRFEDDKLLLSDSSDASYGKWSSGYPRKSTISYYSSYTKVYIYIDTSSYVRKLYNTRPTTKKPYAICSFKLSNSTATTTASP